MIETIFRFCTERVFLRFRILHDCIVNFICKVLGLLDNCQLVYGNQPPKKAGYRPPAKHKYQRSNRNISGAEPDVAVRVRAPAADVQSEHTRVGTVAPIATGEREPFTIVTNPGVVINIAPRRRESNTELIDRLWDCEARCGCYLCHLSCVFCGELSS